jgi:XTP/dITP diphosphohydrolase
MTTTSTLVLASHNAGKLAEFSKLFEPLNWHIYPQSHWNIPECPEPHATFIENALAKARHAAHYSGLPSLADDSGLCVNALGNAPGVYSARYAGSHSMDISASDANNAKLLSELSAIGANESIDRQAYFIAVLVAVKTANDPEPLIATGRWHGYIAHTPSGDNGFGYDPLFICAATQRCAAMMSAAEKSALSHRGKAAQELLQLIHTVW